MSNTEVEFYRSVRKELPEAIAPHAFATVKGSGARFLLALEDLNERGLANLHARFWESSRFAADLSWVKPAAQRPGCLFRHAFERHARERVMSAGYAREFPPEVLRLVHLLGEHDKEMDRLAEQAPLTLCTVMHISGTPGSRGRARPGCTTGSSSIGGTASRTWLISWCTRSRRRFVGNINGHSSSIRSKRCTPTASRMCQLEIFGSAIAWPSRTNGIPLPTPSLRRRATALRVRAPQWRDCRPRPTRR
jgi:hypothetical protein